MPQIACPNCGASVESTERACSYCGAALPASVSSSAPTVRASRDELETILKGTSPGAEATFVSSEPLKKFRSSAEAMDAVKAELRAGRKIQAVAMYREHFEVGLADAKTAVDQIEYNLKFETAAIRSDVEIPAFARPDTPPPATPATGANLFDESKKSGASKWVWGCVAAVVLFCCLCVILPAALYWLTQNVQF